MLVLVSLGKGVVYILTLAYTWARPAVLASDGLRRSVFISSVSPLSFFSFILLCHFSLLYYISSFTFLPSSGSQSKMIFKGSCDVSLTPSQLQQSTSTEMHDPWDMQNNPYRVSDKMSYKYEHMYMYDISWTYHIQFRSYGWFCCTHSMIKVHCLKVSILPSEQQNVADLPWPWPIFQWTYKISWSKY